MIPRRVIVLACALSAAAVPARAGEGEGEERGAARATIATQAPPVDGKLDDAAWQKAPPLVLGEATGAGKARLATTARVLLDGRSLYVGFDCAEPDTASLRKEAADRDGKVWEDDCVEVFVMPDPDLGYKHIAVNARGTVMDQSCAGGKQDLSWNGGVKAAVAVEDGKRWTVTLSVPLKDLEAYVGENVSWRINLTRTRPARGGMALQEYSWAILPTSNFHQPAAFGQLDGVTVPELADGVTRKRDKPVAFPAPVRAEDGARSGDVIAYRKLDFDRDEGGFEPGENCKLELDDDAVSGKALRIRRTSAGGAFGAALPVKIRGSAGLKIAYLCKAAGVPRAGLNVYDQIAADNTTATGYRWLSKDRWSPVLYYVDAFRYNAQAESRVRAQTFFQNIRFHGEEEGAANTWMLVDNFVVYRGDDRTPPSRVEGLEAKPGAEGVRLSWTAASDNAAVMLYAVSRADGPGAPFRKIAESFTGSYLDRVPAPGEYRYRVLACDFEENLGDWSETATAKADAGNPPPAVRPVEVAEREAYRDHVLEIARKGAGKVNRNMVVCYGDSLTAATVYPHEIEGALGTKRVAAYGYPSMQTSFGRDNARANLERDNPFLVLVLFGTNNGKDAKSVEQAMADLAAIAETAAERGIVPIFGTIPPRGFGDPESKPEAGYNAALIRKCADLKVPCGHLFEEYQSLPNRKELIADDGVHNTAAGMTASARAWRRAVEEVQFILRDKP